MRCSPDLRTRPGHGRTTSAAAAAAGGGVAVEQAVLQRWWRLLMREAWRGRDYVLLSICLVVIIFLSYSQVFMNPSFDVQLSICFVKFLVIIGTYLLIIKHGIKLISIQK